MSEVTLDQMPIEAHKRYAHDQISLDKTYMVHTQPVPAPAATSAIYTSEWAELFGIDETNTWATFSAPNHFQSNHCFSYALIPNILETKETTNKSLSKLMVEIKELNDLLTEINSHIRRLQRG
jgi:hypothetical protein